MKQWIRWSGLAGFIITVGLLTVFFLFAAGPLIKSSIEHFGSQAAGAKVSVNDVSLNLSPLGITVTGLEVADAEKPMENLLQFDSAIAELELAPLLLGKGIVRDLSVENLQFNSSRQESGHLEVTEEQVEEEMSQPQAEEPAGSIVNIPTADEILAREPLKTEQAGKALQDSFASHKKAISEATAQVPDGKQLDQYQSELKALLANDIKSLDDFKQRKKQLDKLKKQFKKDKSAIAAARQAISAGRKDISEKLTVLKSAPGDDISTIKSKYQLDAAGASNLSALLFGDEAGQWAEKALYWYEKIKPYLASEEDGAESEQSSEPSRTAGRFVHFPSDNPWPEFLVRRANMSAPAMDGYLKIEALDITHQQALLNRPARIVIQGQQLTNIEDLNIDITLDHRNAPGRDSATLNIKDWAVSDVDLGVAGSRLTSALVQVQGLALLSADTLQAKADAQVRKADFAGDGGTQFAKELNLALAKIDTFDINAKASGKLSSPEIELGSDLDRKLNRAFQQRLKEKQDQLEKKLQARLDEKVQSYLGGQSDDLKQLNQLDGSLDEKTDQLQQMASSKLKDYEAQQKAKAKAKAKKKQDKLKKKAEDKLKKLF